MGTSAARAENARPASDCMYRALRSGPAFEISPPETVVIGPDQTFIVHQAKDSDTFAVHFLDDTKKKEFHKKIGTLAAILNDHDVRVDDHGTLLALNVRDGTRRPLRSSDRDVGISPSDKAQPIGQGQSAQLVTLYSNITFLKLSSADTAIYEGFKQDLAKDTYCGSAISTLPPDEVQRLRPLVTMFLFDSLAAGRMDDYAAWMAHAPIINAFLNRDDLDALEDIYGWRSSHLARLDPVLAHVEPDKVWSFAAMAVEEPFQREKKFFNPDSFEHFTDISVAHKNGKMIATALGTKPIAGSTRNRFGFYALPLAQQALKADGVVQRFRWSWDQAPDTYFADVSISAKTNRNNTKHVSFPKRLTKGLIILDETLSLEEVKLASKKWKAYFEQDGFAFAGEQSIANIFDHIKAKLFDGTGVDYLVKDGHADSDDDNMMWLPQDGAILMGEKLLPTGRQSIAIVFNPTGPHALSKKRSVTYVDLVDWLKATRERLRAPFVYINTSCWGLEKAKASLSRFPSAHFMEVASRTPVNTFTASKADATGIIIDGLRAGEAFTKLRAKLQKLGDYAAGVSDNYIFPDESGYPQKALNVKIDRALSVKKANGEVKPYKPDVYF